MELGRPSTPIVLLRTFVGIQNVRSSGNSKGPPEFLPRTAGGHPNRKLKQFSGCVPPKNLVGEESS